MFMKPLYFKRTCIYLGTTYGLAKYAPLTIIEEDSGVS